ncbi:peptidase U32 family protein [Campylobacter canadensis]|uniref:U32 family peptidase n=1 Tax=Campylobacter canadensis TaxID=449520 RepID=A0ABS7WTQ2_9BACT|nr:peptidase U32 family protein [Campylobacter canadensis]MBZ7988148.1 U32 family peptidase [Campylobacter canadensis]MBZ7999131.1 U32 family peptidase [Campylobacter canadensis]
MIEIVAPAGNLKKLKIAVNYGANAVYAGLSQFSLRSRSAKEFNEESFLEGINYAHSKNVKVYATVNGFHTSAQLDGLKRHLKTLERLKPDALIIASVGAMKLAKEFAPSIPIHVSTQANVLNYADAQVYKELGAKRVVLARELSLKDACDIANNCDVELEAFVHGSMCFAYSGRCLISAVQSGRRSNLGSCANDCRFPYELYAKNPENNALFRIEENESGTHIFNSKDLNLAKYIDKIVQSKAISALKIEGRTKSEYYVACAVRTYAKALKDALNNTFNPSEYEAELNTLKSRGFTDGYLINRPYEKDDTQNHITSIMQGAMQVQAISEDGEFFASKGILRVNESYEIFAPNDILIPQCDNEIGKIFCKDGKYFLEFKKLINEKNKEFNELHSGNINLCKSPVKLCEFVFLRS